MRCRSFATSNTDAYQAGSEIGEALRDLSPEVVLIIAAISFEQNFSDFFDGLHDGLGRDDVLVFGGTGDGIYETSLTAHYGVCALGIATDGRVRWHAAMETGVAADSWNAARSCARAVLDQAGGQAAWAFVLADGVKADGTRIVEGVRSILPIPFVGGLTGDDRKFTRSRIFFNDHEVEDGVAILLATGDLSFVANAASGWLPAGAVGIVEECAGSTVFRISGQSPLTFMKEQVGKPLVEADLGIVPLAVYHDIERGQFSLRTPSRFDASNGAITTFGSINAGAEVKVCIATREQIMQGVSAALDDIMAGGFKPAAAIIISCAGRKWLLDDCGREEVAAVQSYIGASIPLVGFPSFGEMGPYHQADGSYSDTLFHNVTIVICLLGA